MMVVAGRRERSAHCTNSSDHPSLAPSISHRDTKPNAPKREGPFVSDEGDGKESSLYGKDSEPWQHAPAHLLIFLYSLVGRTSRSSP